MALLAHWKEVQYCGLYGPISQNVDILWGMLLLALIEKDHVKSQNKFEFSEPCTFWVLNLWSWVARPFTGWQSFSVSQDTIFKGPYLFKLTWYNLGAKHQFIIYTPKCKDKVSWIPRWMTLKKYSFGIVIFPASTVLTCMLLHSIMYIYILQYCEYALLLGLVYTCWLSRIVLGLLEKH